MVAGRYFYRLVTDDGAVTKDLILVR
jgi:hypothetical protein